DDVFGRLNTAMGNLPEADIPSLTGLNRVCEVFNALDIVVPCPAWRRTGAFKDRCDYGMGARGTMRKESFMNSFFAVLLGFSVTAVFSVPAPAYACAPGCDCSEDGIEGALERRAEAKRVEHKAQAREHIKMNDNAPGMTCFDRALAMTQQLGNIFS